MANLDAKLRVQMRMEILKLHKKLQTTFIYVTHDQTEAMTMGTRIVVMNGGVIQQIDTPQNIYEKPKNKFVASFIGSPQMNFLNIKIIDEKYANVQGNKINIDGLDVKNLDGDVILGIRPEDINISKKFTEKSIRGIVENIEVMGAESYIHINALGKIVIIKENGITDYRSGDKTNFSFNISKVHIFDSKTENRI
ncbi:MAG: ABC transporter ATP-binding protein [Sarcina sp.]